MNTPYELIISGVIFFGFIAVVSIVQARRKKEKTYYLAAVTGFLMIFVFSLALLSQFILAFIVFVVTGVVSVVALPKMIRAQRRELAGQLAKELREMDFSAPLRVRDLLTWKGWLKLAYAWGIWKTASLYSLFAMTVIAGMSYAILSILGIMNIWYVVGYTVSVAAIVFILFYSQISKALNKSKLSKA